MSKHHVQSPFSTGKTSMRQDIALLGVCLLYFVVAFLVGRGLAPRAQRALELASLVMVVCLVVGAVRVIRRGRERGRDEHV